MQFGIFIHRVKDCKPLSPCPISRNATTILVLTSKLFGPLLFASRIVLDEKNSCIQLQSLHLILMRQANPFFKERSFSTDNFPEHLMHMPTRLRISWRILMLMSKYASASVFLF